MRRPVIAGLAACGVVVVVTATLSIVHHAAPAAGERSGGDGPGLVGAVALTPTAPASSGDPTGSPAATSGPSATARPAATPSSTVATARPTTVTVTLAAACVVPGPVQTATVRSTPGLEVTVNTQYADGHRGDTYGGWAVAQTIGQDGSYRLTWSLPSNVPHGSATTYAGVASRSGQRVSGSGSASFVVAGTC
jgi:hypothetical protein